MHHVTSKASHAADSLHPLMPAASQRAGASASALACPHTGAPCPALTGLFAPLAISSASEAARSGPDDEAARAWVRGLAPCDGCRVACAAGRDNLRHLRLGQREREILLGVAGGLPLVLTEAGMSRSLSAARRRAAISLTKAGLIAPVPMPALPKAPGAVRAQRATVAITPLGCYVMAAYGRFISAGKPVRWTRPARGALLPGREPELLVDEALQRCQAALKSTLAELMGVLVAAVGRPLKSPGLLDTVTRHLEQKATLLRAVLEPRTRLAVPPAGGLPAP